MCSKKSIRTYDSDMIYTTLESDCRDQMFGTWHLAATDAKELYGTAASASIQLKS